MMTEYEKSKLALLAAIFVAILCVGFSITREIREHRKQLQHQHTYFLAGFHEGWKDGIRGITNRLNITP